METKSWALIAYPPRCSAWRWAASRRSFSGGIWQSIRSPSQAHIGGQSGHFAHNFPELCPNGYVGEPGIVRILNAGLWTHSMHLHCNHIYILCVNNVVRDNLLNLGHIDFKADGRTEPKLPGDVCVPVGDLPLLTVGQTFRITRRTDSHS